jgi:hypothetical protein
LTTWTQSSGESPDRLDALVWAISSLGIAGTDGIIPDFVPVGLGKSNAFDLGGLGRL